VQGERADGQESTGAGLIRGGLIAAIIMFFTVGFIHEKIVKP
jgi:hypothetical protein